MPSFNASTPTVLVFNMMLSKRFSLNFCQTLTMSRSAPCIRPSIISTTSMRAPSVEYTVAISRPMMPPPMTSMRFGTWRSSSAPVESTMRGSCGTKGRFGTDELADTLYDVDLARFGHASQTTGHGADDFFLVGAQFVDIDFRLGECDSV